MLSPQTLERVSHSYRRGYYDGYDLRASQNLPVLTTDSGVPMKPFSDHDYTKGHLAGLNDRYWSDFRAGHITEERSSFMEKHTMTDRYQIPRHDESPSEEMIEWLHENIEDWSGDECGIVLIHTDGGEEHGAPDDWIVRDKDGRYSIEKEKSDEA